jgi:uncharacterized protein
VTFIGNGAFTFYLLNQTLILLSEKAIFWQEKGILLLADVHLGKVNHFRKAGIAVPQLASATDYIVLDRLLHQSAVQEVFFLGDLFHSKANQACEEFAEWIKKYPHVQFRLVKGNHDILSPLFYDTINIKVFTETVIKPPFILSHIPLTEKTPYYNLSGHLHPAIKLYGKGKQVLTLPCFYFGKLTGILPAFGSFTGGAIINIEPGSSVFAIAGSQVRSLNCAN